MSEETTTSDATESAPTPDAPAVETAVATTTEAAPAEAAPAEAAPAEAAPAEAAPAEAAPVEPEPEPVVHPPTDRPFLVVTALVDAGSRAAPATVSHGDAMERALGASAGVDLAGLDLVELSISPAPFGALRKALNLAEDTVALYDVFPLASHLSPEVRKVAGQFLAAEAVWTLEDQGLLGGVPLNARLSLPKGWERDPKSVHGRLVNAQALNLSAKGIDAFKAVKGAWDSTAAS
ncbi:MAG: hypothetical protein ACI9KE_001369 [Polyangiales bacterium]|jgi:hypothetical protein